MKVTVNDLPQSWPEPILTVRELLERMNYTFPLIVVKINDRLVPKSEYASVPVHDGDRVAAIHLISGG